ncbi:competence/damage-inducible protein A [Hippea alviniae]|uniref:competence/damage-inducible protein A n=1 Tax=Hippea alviniae TaxID=1279027 RepID=UPI00040CFBA1|nr:molybdopterin-binding protein [Hippea alviniae]
MLKSAVISVGKEIVGGITLDTNSFFIAGYLLRLGFNNRHIIAVDDEKEEIIETINFLLNKVDVIITTGGLGPTFDDKTMESVAAALKLNLYLDADALKFIDEFYTKLYNQGRIDEPGLNEKRRKMAYLIEGCKPLKNSVGAAYGCYIKYQGKHIFVLPGVPKEMKPMFENEVVPILKEISDGVIVALEFEFKINDESVLGELIDKVMRKSEVYIKSLPVGFESDSMGVRFTAYGESESKAKEKILRAKEELENLLKSKV